MPVVDYRVVARIVLNSVKLIHVYKCVQKKKKYRTELTFSQRFNDFCFNTPEREIPLFLVSVYFVGQRSVRTEANIIVVC